MYPHFTMTSQDDVIELSDDDDFLEALNKLSRQPKPNIDSQIAAIKEVTKRAQELKEAEEWRNYKRRRAECNLPRRSPSPDPVLEEMKNYLASLSKAEKQMNAQLAALNPRKRRSRQQPQRPDTEPNNKPNDKLKPDNTRK